MFSEEEKPKAEDMIHRMVKRAVEMEGTVTGEHGVGLIKRDYLPHELGESTVDAMRKASDFPFNFQSIFNFAKRGIGLSKVSEAGQLSRNSQKLVRSWLT
jgi:hypothetical protein